MNFQALDFDGDGYLFADSVARYDFGLHDFTVEAWVKTTSGGTILGRKSDRTSEGGFLLVARPDGTIRFVTYDARGYFEIIGAPSAVCDGVWHHVAAVRSGTTLALYLDGQPLPGTFAGTAPPPLNVSNGLRLTIGTVDRPQEPYRGFIGSLAELRLWSRQRTPEEIAAGSGRRLAPGTPDLVGYWSAELGLTVDFSTTRNATHASGMVMPTTDAPAVGPGAAPPMLFLFSGVYDTAVKPPGAKVWQPAAPLYLTSMGHVVQDGRVIADAVIAGPAIHWPLQGNPMAGKITFLLSSSDPRYWPDHPQTRYDFQGAYQTSDGHVTEYRGVIRPRLSGCGLLLNLGSSEVLYTPNAGAGVQVTLAPKKAQIHEHFCVFDNDHILHMHSGLALSVQGDPIAGAPIVFAQSAVGRAAQQWTFGDDGLIRLAQRAQLAMAVDHSHQPARLVLAAADPANPAQQFITLSNGQSVWNAVQSDVLSAIVYAGVYSRVGARAKASDAAAELWYLSRDRLINAINGHVLTVIGRATPGAPLGLSPFQAGNAAQGFAFDLGQLTHIASGLPVKMMALGGAVFLGAAGEIGDALRWAIAPARPAGGQSAHARPRVPRTAARRASLVTGEVSYVIRVYTGDFLAAGTDDKVEVALIGDRLSSAYVELKHSETHADPFERGNMDQFTVSLPNVGSILGINVRYGASNWLWNDRWVVEKITVYDPTTITLHSSGHIGNGLQYTMPSQTYIDLGLAWIGGDDSTMSLGKAPSTDNITRGWVDHTWLVAKDSERTTYFDCAGGHGGNGAIDNIISVKCSLDTAVKMATGYYIDSQHPYQPVYGHDDVSGKETCGIRASGFRGWDGQCHQIANRLLYICNPQISIDDAPDDKRPAGYGLAVLMFGRYGVEFDTWCRVNGFPPPSGSNTSLFDFVRRWVSDERHGIAVAYEAIALQQATAGDPQNPRAPAVHEFFRAVKADGVSNSTMARLVCLPEDKVIEEQQG